jgi:hypothetical protein
MVRRQKVWKKPKNGSLVPVHAINRDRWPWARGGPATPPTPGHWSRLLPSTRTDGPTVPVDSMNRDQWPRHILLWASSSLLSPESTKTAKDKFVENRLTPAGCPPPPSRRRRPARWLLSPPLPFLPLSPLPLTLSPLQVLSPVRRRRPSLRSAAVAHAPVPETSAAAARRSAATARRSATTALSELLRSSPGRRPLANFFIFVLQ